MDICLRVLKESNKKQFRQLQGREQCIDHDPLLPTTFFKIHCSCKHRSLTRFNYAQPFMLCLYFIYAPYFSHAYTCKNQAKVEIHPSMKNKNLIIKLPIVEYRNSDLTSQKNYLGTEILDRQSHMTVLQNHADEWGMVLLEWSHLIRSGHWICTYIICL